MIPAQIAALKEELKTATSPRSFERIARRAIAHAEALEWDSAEWKERAESYRSDYDRLKERFAGACDKITAQETELATLRATIAGLEKERDEMRSALVLADRCLSGHVLGINCHGPSIPQDKLAYYRIVADRAFHTEPLPAPLRDGAKED